MILQITNDFSGSALYKNLFDNLDNLGLTQIVYHPLKFKNQIGKNAFAFNNSDSKIIYSLILNKFSDRLFYRRKINKIYKDVDSKVNLKKITFVHAHTWYSDGGVAYFIKKKYKIPYIVAIRSSDIVYFYKLLIWEREFALKILNEAERIVFISESYHELFLSKVRFNNLDLSKIIVIPNGIDDFWITNYQNKTETKKQNSEHYDFKVVYVGQFIKRKNVEKLVKAVQLLNAKSVRVQLNLVGDFTKSRFNIENFSKLEYVNLCGEIKNKVELIQVYRNNDVFAMPSINETFGLVYVEALSQGLPILYTKRDGIDGFYSNVGESVSKPINENDICDRLMFIYQNYKSYDFDILSILRNHNWKEIAKQYYSIYTSC